VSEPQTPIPRTDPASVEMRERAKAEGVETIWDRYAALGTQCKVGELGICCTVCHLGPCNLGLPGSKRPKVGVCGATVDTVASRRLARDMAAGSAAHSDHGRSVANLLLKAARGEAPGYEIKDEAKLSWASSATASRSSRSRRRSRRPASHNSERRRTASPSSSVLPRSNWRTGASWTSSRGASTVRSSTSCIARTWVSMPTTSP